jgi:hypothetical protein
MHKKDQVLFVEIGVPMMWMQEMDVGVMKKICVICNLQKED